MNRNARRIWQVFCDGCKTIHEFDGAMTFEQLDAHVKAAGWYLPTEKGHPSACPECVRASPLGRVP